MNLLGTSKRSSRKSIDWSALLSLLEDDDQRAAIQCVHPAKRRESFLSALRRIDATTPQPDSVGNQNPPDRQPADHAQNVLAAGRQFHTAEQLVDWPTVAVAGMLNSGKTSLVGTFLSAAGRARTLCGVSNQEGTHRFVLWLPSQWETDTELWSLLMQQISDALGQPPEMLSTDPAAAHRQYNNRHGAASLLSVPLVATDPQLNEIGIGLLDCPDIVSDEEFGLGSPEARRDMLGRAATLCSAFMVVTSAESSRDATLGDLLRIASDLMPGIPRMLAVNKIRPRQTPDQVFETFNSLAKNHGIETIYAAYDFEIPSSRPFIPTTTDQPLRSIDDDETPLPVFFSLCPSTEDNPPAAIQDDRLLKALPNRLDRGALFESFCYSLEQNLHQWVRVSGLNQLKEHAERSQDQTTEAQRCLMGAALDFFAIRDIGAEITQLRLHQSERIIRQLSESFAVTAPWYARWGVRMNAKIRSFWSGAGNLFRNLSPTAIAERAAGDIKEKFRRGEYGGILTPEKLIHAIIRHGGATKLPHWPSIHAADFDRDNSLSPVEPAPSPTKDSSGDHESRKTMWKEAAEEAILSFEREDFTALDPRRLDEAVRQLWSEMPRGRKLLFGLTPLGALLATFGGVLTLPVDFGSTLVIASASMSELFVAGGLTTFATLWAGKQNTRALEQQAARQQVADFHAVLCDAFGVARMDGPYKIKVGPSNEKLPTPKIPLKPPKQHVLTLYRTRQEFADLLAKQFPDHAR